MAVNYYGVFSISNDLFAHRELARFVLSSKNKDADFTDVVEEHFGVTAERLISLLYFLSIFPILLIYGVA
ncbi:serine transporter [Pseudoalteromonas sp. BSi20495]|nr:serine transporter [Pseudoalteromonas sp. BSi20495]